MLVQHSIRLFLYFKYTVKTITNLANNNFRNSAVT